MVGAQPSNASCQFWSKFWRRWKWQFAGRIIRSEKPIWSKVATFWQPLLHMSGQRWRKGARPRKTWCDDFGESLNEKLGKNHVLWKEVAQSKADWDELNSEFAIFANT